MSTAISSMSFRTGTLSPPSTATNGANITRADFQRWAHEDRNHAQGDMTRTEREERRRFKSEQKELFRSRGAALKDAQKLQMTEAASQVATHRSGNASIGSTLREAEDNMRKRRSEQQKKWADHGYELTQQYTIKAAQNNMRSLKAQNAGIVNNMHSKRTDRRTVRTARSHRPLPSHAAPWPANCLPGCTADACGDAPLCALPPYLRLTST